MLTRLLDFFFPRTCVICDRRLAIGEQFVCPPCLMSLPLESVATDWQLNRHVFQWRSEHPVLYRMGALCIYHRENAAAHLVHALKFERNREQGIWMGRLAAKKLKDTDLFDGVDAFVPLPLSRARQRHRGFNQAEAIAQGLSQETGIPLRTDLLVRNVDRESQTHFQLSDRFLNGRDLFSLAEGAEASGQHLMLVDDVLTTGATMMSAVSVLENFSDVRISTFAWAWVNMSIEVWAHARRVAGLG